MDLRQLRSVVVLGEEGHFTRAAERLHIAQSSLSAQIRALEDELGLALFDRTTRRVAPTQAGALLIERARAILAQVHETTDELQQIRGVLTGKVTIGITQSPGPIDIVALLSEFHARYPGIELSVREDLSVPLADELREDRLDLGILSIVEPADCQGLAVELLAAERLVAVLPADHPLVGRERIAVSELCASPFIASPPGATIRDAVIAAAARDGAVPHVAFESREVTRIRALVAAGLGVATLPASDALRAGPPVAIVQLQDPPITHRLSLCWRESRYHQPAVRALLAHVRQTFSRDGHGGA